MNEDMAYILGVLKGDGCIYWRRLPSGKREPMIILEARDPDFAQSFLDSIKVIAPWVKAKIYCKKRYSKILYRVCVSAVKLFPIVREAQTENLLTQNHSIIAHFLRGYYDSEGHVTKDSIVASSTDYELIKLVQTLLKQLNIRAKIYGVENRGYLPDKRPRRNSNIVFRLRTCDYNSRFHFAQKIGFSIKRKQKALEESLRHRKQVSHSKQEYVKALALRKEGFTIPKIAEQLKVPEGTIRRWIYSSGKPWEVRREIES